MVEENGWSWRSWRSRAGQQAHILEKCRKKYVGRAGIWIHDDVRHNSIHGSWNHWCPPYELGMEFTVVVEGNGVTNDTSIWEGQISARVADATEILLSLTTVKNVMVSMNKDWWHWVGEVSAGRVKSRGREELSIQWELGIRDDGYVPGQVTYSTQKYRTCARLYFEGQVPEWPRVRFHVGVIRKWHTSS